MAETVRKPVQSWQLLGRGGPWRSWNREGAGGPAGGHDATPWLNGCARVGGPGPGLVLSLGGWGQGRRPWGHVHGLSRALWAWSSEKRSALEIPSDSSVVRTPAECTRKLNWKWLQELRTCAVSHWTSLGWVGDNWTVSLRSGPDCAAQRVAHGLRGCGCGSQHPEAEGGPSPWVSLSPCPTALPRLLDPRPSVGRVCSHASQACACRLA